MEDWEVVYVRRRISSMTHWSITLNDVASRQSEYRMVEYI